MLIYIRHGHDEYDDATYNHDNRITDKGRSEARQLARKLVRKHGPPHKIYCSPFRRTVDTLAEMARSLDRIPEIVYSPELSRYFSPSDRSAPDIAPETGEFRVPVNEGRDGFLARVEKHVEAMRRHQRSRKVVWCITHALVFKRVSRLHSVPCSHRVDFLQNFVVPKDSRPRFSQDPRSNADSNALHHFSAASSGSDSDHRAPHSDRHSPHSDRHSPHSDHRHARKLRTDPLYFEMFGAHYSRAQT